MKYLSVDADWLWKSTLICFWTCPPSTPWRAGGPTHCNSVPWCHTCNAITIPSVSYCMTSTKCLLMVFIEIAISSAQFIVLQSSGRGEHRCMMVWTWLPSRLYIHWSLLFAPSHIQYCLSRSIVTLKCQRQQRRSITVINIHLNSAFCCWVWGHNKVAPVFVY